MGLVTTARSPRGAQAYRGALFKWNEASSIEASVCGLDECNALSSSKKCQEQCHKSNSIYWPDESALQDLPRAFAYLLCLSVLHQVVWAVLDKLEAPTINILVSFA